MEWRKKGWSCWGNIIHKHFEVYCLSAKDTYASKLVANATYRIMSSKSNHIPHPYIITNGNSANISKQINFNNFWISDTMVPTGPLRPLHPRGARDSPRSVRCGSWKSSPPDILKSSKSFWHFEDLRRYYRPPLRATGPNSPALPEQIGLG